MYNIFLSYASTRCKMLRRTIFVFLSGLYNLLYLLLFEINNGCYKNSNRMYTSPNNFFSTHHPCHTWDNVESSWLARKPVWKNLRNEDPSNIEIILCQLWTIEEEYSGYVYLHLDSHERKTHTKAKQQQEQITQKIHM